MFSIALMLTQLQLEELTNNKPLILSIIKEVYPDEYKVMDAIDMIKRQGFGKLTVHIKEGNVVLIEPTVSLKIR
jgi:ABC-type methionine transport system ATPase subunit